ncbi:MAG TPA: helix-turn-helix domain-containing protein [Candidatus Thermoplasmatota archaeon]|nr:helix-turn-helix domain-containing protein [Candidatus Thermoplasmatota archaeon]
MDGPPLRQVTFRVEHDCPLARLSRECPGTPFRAWSAHRHEVVEVSSGPERWRRALPIAERLLKPERTIPLADGGLIVWEPHVPPERSLSRVLESHQLLWLQPTRVEDGWEHYDAVAFGPRAPEEALKALAAKWPTQVVRRREVGPDALLASLFQSLRPLLEAPTDKQAEALVAAWRAGYYGSPRNATTAEVAKRMGLGRSAFEERLRGGENHLLGSLAPVLEHHRLHHA